MTEQKWIKTKDIPSKGGVYAIRCTANGSVYYGSSCCLKARVPHHKFQLAAGKHHNSQMQADYAKHGAANFTCEILHLSDDVEARLRMESKHIRKASPNQRYNSLHGDGTCPPGQSRQAAAVYMQLPY